MKWIGQHIWDFISRFRNDVYLENIADHGSDPDRFLTMDSTTGKVSYRTGTEVLNDIGGSSSSGTVDTSGSPVDNDYAKFTDANTLEGRSYAEVKQDLDLEIGTDVLAQQAIGIANDNLVEIDDADVANGDYAKFTADGLEGREASEVLSDIGAITASSSDTLTNKTIAASQVTEISNLTADEGAQLENIGTTTISATQWGYLGAATGAITNTDTTYSEATSSDAGLMSTAHHDKLDGIAAGAEVNVNADWNSSSGDSQISNKPTVIGFDGSTANGVLTYKDADEATVEAGLTFNGDTLTMASSTSAQPSILMIANNDEPTGPTLNFLNNSEGEDNDELGTWLWQGYNDNNQNVIWASILGQISDATDGEEAGKMSFRVAEFDGGLNTGLLIDGDTDEDGEVDVTIGAGNGSTTTIAGTLTMGTTAAMTNAGLLSVANQSNITGLGTISSGTWEGATIAVDQGGTGVTTVTDFKNVLDDETWTFTNDVTLTSGTASKPVLTLEATETTGGSSAELKFVKNANDVADGEYLGMINWYGDNDAGTPETINYATIRTRVGDMTDGQESGRMYLQVASYDGILSTGLKLDGETDVDNQVDVTLGSEATSTTTIAGDLTVTSKAVIPTRKFTATSSTHFEHQGDVIYFGGGSTTQGDLCYLQEDGEWGQADADGAATGDDADRDATGMLAIALGSDPAVNGMLIRGVITMDYDMGDVANPIYISTTAGAMTSTAPTASGDFVRIVGYCLDDANGQIYFNPDNTWVEITA
jgi:hypothetical protein